MLIKAKGGTVKQGDLWIWPNQSQTLNKKKKKTLEILKSLYYAG